VALDAERTRIAADQVKVVLTPEKGGEIDDRSSAHLQSVFARQHDMV
jgi:hypothetical protein